MENGRTAENGIYNETDIIETTDEEGAVHIFEKISELEIDGQEYALLIYKGNEYKGEGEGESADEDAEEGYDEDVVVMRIGYEDGQEVFEAIEDEDEFNRVVAYIENMDDDEVSIDLSNVKDLDEESPN